MIGIDTNVLLRLLVRDQQAKLRAFERSSAGFTDRLLARTNNAAGCGYTVTFDRKAAKLAAFKLLKSG